MSDGRCSPTRVLFFVVPIPKIRFSVWIYDWRRPALSICTSQVSRVEPMLWQKSVMEAAIAHGVTELVRRAPTPFWFEVTTGRLLERGKQCAANKLVE
jgi:hypothetical protein